VLQAFGAAIIRPDLIEAEAVDILENQDLAEKYNAYSVPQTLYNDKLQTMGLEPEAAFIEELMNLAEVSLEAEAPISPGEAEVTERDLVILGGGPAGLTAAIYAARSGLDAVVVEKGNLGGQVAETPVVENYPGFTRVAGRALVDMMVNQASQYAKIFQNETPVELHAPQEDSGRFEVVTNKHRFLARALLLTTGASYRRLDVPGEQRFYGRGVSYCATCDGYIFKGKKVIMIGGGNSAVTEALYLDNVGAKVTLVHRRGELRAEKRLQDALEDRKVPILWNTELREVRGKDHVTGALLADNVSHRMWEEPVDGVFISIGYVPQNEAAKQLGAVMDNEGYVKVDHEQRTSVPGLYAAGDVTGGIKQITTAVGQGAVAALSIFHDLEGKKRGTAMPSGS